MIWIRRLFLALVGVLGLVVLTLLALRGIALWHESAELAQSIPTEGRRVPTALGMIYVEEAGPADGTPLLLIHGSVGWSRLWAGITPALTAAGYRTIAMDLPPMGYSDPDPDDDYSRQRQAAKIVALTQALGIRPILVAHSFGAGPAAEAALRTPDAFAGMVFISAAIGMGADSSREMPLVLRPLWLRELAISATATNLWATGPLTRLFLYRKDSLTEADIAVLQQPWALRGTTRAMAAWLPTLIVPPRDALSTRPESFAASPLPMALIWGDRDTTTPLAQGEALQLAHGRATLAILPEVGHIPQIEDPAALRAALVAALASLAQGR